MLLEFAQAMGWRPADLWASTWFEFTTAAAWYAETNNPRPKPQRGEDLQARFAALAKERNARADH